MTRWITQHMQALALALRKFVTAPWNTVASLLAMGVAFSLPAGGFVLLENLGRISAQVDSAPQISLFLALDAARSDLSQTEKRLRQHPQVKSFQFVPKDKALARLKASAGVADVVESLGQNPLPDAFVVQPRTTDAEILEQLRAEMAQWPKAEHVQLDSAWAKRLDALLRFGRLAIAILAALLSLALLTAVFNTIRLQILTQREEIEVAKLVGATDGFIRRPFLYQGALQGLLGGSAAWLILAAGLWLLNSALADLAQLYAISLRLDHLSPRDTLVLLGLASGLGWIGAWMSVGRHLSAIQPR
ncbi:MAG TPA: permease-like cell division protein FtsX [Burkholderiales bacterium]